MMMRSCMVLSCVLALAVLPAAAGIAAPDTYEPDDTAALAKPLPVATAQTRTIFPQGDVDWVSLSVPGPSLIAVEVETNDSEPPILLTTAAGRPVTLTAGGDGSGFSRVQAVVTAGTYYLRVNSADNLAVGSYRITQGQWTASEATPQYRFARLWPLEQQRQDFSNIGAIAVTNDASVLITDSEFDAVQKFTQDGQFLTQFGPGIGSPGHFDDAGGITTIFNGDVLVSDTGNNQVERFSSVGSYLTTWNIGGVPGGPGEPRGITSLFDVDAGSSVFVADPVNGQIFVFNNAGAIINSFTPAVAPTDMASDGVNAYFLDPPASSGVVTTLNRNAQSLGSFAFLGLPRAITVDENGFVLVGNETPTTDGPSLQIIRYTPNVSTPDGTFNLFVPLRTGSGAEVAMATDKRGGLYVAEKSAGIISKYQTRLNPPQLVNIWGQNDDEDGRFLRPRGLAVAPDGSIVVADSGNNRVQRFSADGQFLDEAGIEGSELGAFNLPHDVAVDEDGHVYVIETRNNRVQVLDPDLQPLFAFGTPGDAAAQLNAPEGIGLGYTSDGALLVYVADTGNDRIQLFDRDGAWISTLGGFGSAIGQFDAPGDVAVGPDGSVYVADSDNARIQRFFPGTEIPPTAWLVGDAARPQSVFVAQSGLVCVADAANNRIAVYSAWGQSLATLGQRGTAPIQFRAPGGIAGDGAGGILVADTFNHRIQEFELRLTPPPVKRAVLVAGAGPLLNSLDPNPIWDPTVNNVNLAYRALRHQGYARDEIRLYSGGQSYDIDGDGVNDDFQMASDDTLDVAFSWLAEADDALFYIVGNSDDGDIYLNQNPEYLTKTKLNILLDKLSAGAVKRALAVIDAPGSGQFLSTAREGTVVITSCDTEGAAYFLTKGTISFSSYFWLGVFNGLSFRQAFMKARTDLADAVQYQVPQFADPSNGELFDQIDFADENDFREQRPVLGNVAPVQVLNLADSSFDLQVQDITDDGLRLIRVWAIITKPSDIPGNFDPVFNRPHVDLIPNLAGAKGGDEDFDGEYTDADEEGVYKVDYFSMDENGNVSQGESGYAVKSGEAPGTMNFTVRRQGTATAITNASVCISPPLVPCEESNVDGIYSLLVLATQNYGVTISADGYNDYDASLLLQAGTTGSTIVQLEPTGGSNVFHTADYNPANFKISLQELLRVIQFFNLFDYHCDEAGEEGFAPGTGDTGCTPHNSDYNPQNWKISLQELLRLIQFFNIGAYHIDANGEDGFVPGAEKLAFDAKQAGGLTGNVQLAQVGPFSAGDPLDTTITLNYSGADAITSLGIIMNMPAGFTFVGVQGGETPDTFRFNAADNTVEGFWIVPPAFPISFSYRMTADAAAATAPYVGGKALYRTTGAEMQAVISTCTPPATPTGITASQNLADRVQISWNAAAGATAYRVYRSTNSNFGQAQPLSNWITATSFSDSTALAPVTQDSGGCGGAPAPEPVPYYYWVVARSGESCESNPGGAVQGFRSAAKALEAALGGNDLGNLVIFIMAAAGVHMARRRKQVVDP